MFQIRKEGQIKIIVRTLSISIIMTAVTYLILIKIENPVLAMIGFMSVLFAFIAYIILVEGPKTQLKTWKGFFEAKSVVYETPDFNGFKSAIDDYISRDKNYYTDERSIDRRAVEKINN